ncbi:hypothetical protein L195_g043955 [Trifolium pratense]|uniref:Uncharacterized protein n=1 Tax=Trifolium pratense TaxID=57577 RepID=A0A2K3MAP5_TRIPR|nr:hypothetical protein L195_g043955 [Trifolium pratense]
MWDFLTQSHKLRVQERIAANLEEHIAFEELDKGLEPLLEVEVSSKYKTNEEIVAHWLEVKINNYQAFVDLLSNELQFLEEDYLD